MSLPADLVNVCLVVTGFPPEICPGEVAQKVLRKTGTAVRAIAPLYSESNPGGGWLLRLHCHDDQKQCLVQHRTFSTLDGSRLINVKLDFPRLSITPKDLEWIDINQQGDGQMDSIATEDLFGDGDNTARKKFLMDQEPGRPEIPVYASPVFQGQPRHPPPPYTRSGPYYPQHPFPVYNPQQGYVQSPGMGHPPNQPVPFHTPNPSQANLGVDPRSNAGSVPFSMSTAPDTSSQMPQQPYYSPAGQGRPSQQYSFYPQHQPGPDHVASPCESNPSYSTGKRPEEGTPAHLHMANLKLDEPSLTQDPIEPYQDYSHNPDVGFQSDFVVLDSPAEHQQHSTYLRVSELPESVTERELAEFFQQRQKSGGGPVSSVKLDQKARTASIVFNDEEDVQRVIQRAPHLLKNKKIKVEAASVDQQEAEIKMVEVRGLQTENDAEMCTYYFENPAKGGGDIEDSQWNDSEKIFLITFKDAAVAKAVASKGHQLKNMVLEVSLYTPPAENEDQPQCTVLVRGFDPSPSNRLLYEMYFSNPRKGGDNILELRVSEDETEMYITFEHPEIAERVAGMTHVVGKRQLDVTLAPIEQPVPLSTVIVKGGDLKKAELYRLYFENPRKGGGDIDDFIVDETQNAIIITFSDPEVAQQIVERPHKVGKVTLDVAMYTPTKSPPQRQASKEPVPTEEEEAPAPKTVMVMTGPKPLESEDTYLFYFENPRYGGGEVEEVHLDDGNNTAFVTFSDAEVAARVAAKHHKIGGNQVEVKLYVPPKPKPTYPNKLLFKNVADSTTRDCLCMYLERVTGLEPVEVLYGDEVGTVLITFDQEPDFAKTVQKCQKKPLERRNLTVCKVPITNIVLVGNLHAQTTSDTIQLYFENKRSNGGPVEKVIMMPEHNKCFIHFEDHEVIEEVLKKPHKLDGSQLVVKRYMECVGESGGSEDPTAFNLPKPLVLDALDRYKVAFLRQSHTARSGFLQQLATSHGRGNFSGDKLVVECTLTPTVPKARILARTWTVDVQHTVDNYVSLLEVLRRDVMQQLWQEVAKGVSAAGFKNSEGAILFTLPDETAFVVVGMKSMAQELFTKVSTTVKAVEEEIERRNQQVSEINRKLKSYQLRLLLAIAFHTEAEKRHPGLKIEIQLKKNCVAFNGLLKDVKESQVEMYEVLQPVQSEKMTKLSDMQKKILENKETKPHIVQKFKKEKVEAVWELDPQSILIVYAFSDASLVKAIHIIDKSVPEHVCELSSESAELLHGSAWKKMVGQLIAQNPGVLMITPSHDSQKVFITSIDSVMHSTVEEIEVFLQENSVYTQVVRFSPSRQLFIQQEWQHKLVDLQRSFQAYRVQITMREAGTELYIKGTNQGLEAVRKGLEQLNSQIICHKERIDDVAKMKCLSSPNTERDLKVLGQTNHCVVSLSPEGAELKMEQPGSTRNVPVTGQDMKDVQTITSVQLPNGVTIAAIQGDITQLNVDVIVNAANNRMDHIGGLAKIIVDKGGPTIQEESYRAVEAKGRQLSEGDYVVTGGGQLPCKAIIHAVGPVYRGGYSGEEDCMHDMIMKCIDAATNSGLTSIAFPAISTGIFRYPAKEATRVIAEATKTYFDSHRKTKMKGVYMCHINADVVRMFADCIHRLFPSARNVSTIVQKPVPQAKPRSSLKGGMSSVGDGTAKRVIKVEVKEGEIAKQSADVIVNSTSNGLEMKNGAVSSSILKEAGSGLQDECRQKYPKGIQQEEVARTSGHSLRCKEVFHIALCNWTNPNAQQILGCAMINCLKEASQQRYSSIAFPVLGTGNLGYPATIVAETMLGAIDDFQLQSPSTSLRHASIVIYHADKKNMEVFKETEKKFGGSVVSPGMQTTQNKPAANRQTRRFSTPQAGQANPAAKAAAGTSAEFEIGNLKLVIKQGDITEEAADAIVNSSNARLDLTRGNVANALKAKCGPQLAQECGKKVGEIQQNGITHTKAYNLKSKVILHINSERFSSDWGEALKLCLELSENLGVQTLAMPALGTGLYGQTPSQSAAALFRSLTKFTSASRSVKEIRVVLFDIRMIPPFVSAIEEMGNEYTKSNKGGFLNTLMSVFGGSSPEVKQTYLSSSLKEMTLYIYAGNQTDIPMVLRAFDDLVKDRYLMKEISDEIILTLGPAEIEQICQLQKDQKVEVVVQQARGRVQLRGLQSEVFEAMQKLSQILRSIESSRQELQMAFMVSNMVQWSFLCVTTTETKPVEYDQKENQKIEMAYQNKKKSVEFTDADGNVYVVDFNAMVEYPKLDPTDTVGVLRRDKIKEQAGGTVPDNWAPHGPNEHVKVVALQQTDAEYKTVETNFRSTLGNQAATITAIARVQNRTLYQQYSAKKSHLDKQNTGINNEKTLWHGTGADAIENINNYGFNRSYCGKNATAFGQGVYFAVNTSYSTSTTYSPADAAGNRHIYQCKVLVGHPTKGSSNLRVLPARQGPILFDSAANDLKNPIMYVIFNDTQAYPEYLVTFK